MEKTLSRCDWNFYLPVAVGDFNGNVSYMDFDSHRTSSQIKMELQIRA
jgi:hypothetical protein